MDRYEIQVAGHLDQRRAKSLGCDALRLLPDGGSRLGFAGLDQAAMFGLMTRLRDAGLELIAVERVPRQALAPTADARRTRRSKEDSDAAD
ncbi:MAG: hypothetical protein ACYDAN_16450 [Candidatus Limnocylindrales bacterium]